MSLIIDGYNVLCETGIGGLGRGPRSLERSRLALLNFLAQRLDPAEAARTTVVFDAAGAPPGLPTTLTHRGINVRFAKGYADADSLIEELIGADSVPRQLTVVSSDHRLQRAARRRKAHAVDSSAWYDELAARRREAPLAEAPLAKPRETPSADELEYWLGCFEDAADEVTDAEQIFPPGYAEDEEGSA